MINVTAAIIRKNGKILVARRAAGQHLAGFWEFPGGKIEDGETPEECLARELREELGIDVAVGACAGENIHHYSDKTIRLLAYHVTIVAGDPVPVVHDAIKWVAPARLSELELAAADQPLVAMIQNTLPEFYESHAREYFAATHDLDPEAFLSPLAAALTPGATVLDVGCGAGRDLAWLRRRGYEPTGLEFSSALARLAREHSGCPVIEGDFFTFDFTPLSFDAILLIGTLVHLQRQQLACVLERIAACLAPGGLVLLTLKEGEGVYSLADGRVFTLWQQSVLEHIFAALGLEIMDSNRQISRLRPSDVWLGYLLQARSESGHAGC